MTTLTEQITRLAAWTVDPTTFPEPCVDDVQGLFHALAEAQISLEDMSENYGNAEGELKLAEDRAEAAESALAEANERASLLRDTVRTRCAERDEARKDLENMTVARDWFHRQSEDHETRAQIAETALAVSEARRAEAYRLGFEASGEGWNGEYPFEGVNLETSPSEHALAWRKGRAGDLNPQQEGSRDHGR